MDLPPSTPPATVTHTVVVGVSQGGKPDPKYATQKLRLMVSFNGHIVPRPHDKTLVYAGGETRIISIPRTPSLSLSSLVTHISKSLLNGSHNFQLKYQLPNHDLDSLISISSDEDLHNMIDEYDRLASLSSPSSSRIRFFLFRKEEGGGLREDDWFVDALKVAGSNPVNESSPESIVLESSSSFGSNSSTSNNSPGKNKAGVADDFKVVLPSLDSLGSDCSIPSPNFSQQAIVYQDATGFFDPKPVSVNLIETESNASDRSPRSDILAPVQVSGYMMSKPMDQPQHQSQPPPAAAAALSTATPHYIHYPASQSNYVSQYYPNSIPVASYTPMYQTYVQPQQTVQYQLNKPYPVYMMPMEQTQNLYDAPMPRTLTTAPNFASNQPQVPSNPVVVSSPMVYEGYNKPAAPAPEYAAEVYRPTAVPTQPMTLPPVHPQPVTVLPLENTNYISEYEDPMHAQIYKTQPSGLTLPSQLQMATSAATVMLPESFSQLQVDKSQNTKH